ncbi:hypothetical protein VNO78_22632 [Psophocarpus tetragonolobus]|uniref:Uncharacterized protein n=1 Tax=Psophocarpus tetragonolobus TaxID=3891 RepID=A0AAN9XCD7_PSOTE
MSGEPLLGSSRNEGTTEVTNTNSAFSAVGSFIKLLPTGTVFVFQFLNPVLTNSGECEGVNKWLGGILLVVCAFSCAFSSFTDSYIGSDNKRHYGIVTFKGVWPSPASDTVDLSAYRLGLGDFVHAALSLLVFAVLGLLDTNTVNCFYPGFQSTQLLLLQALPTAIGVFAGSVFVIFPNHRHGIGYPLSASYSTATPTPPQQFPIRNA